MSSALALTASIMDDQQALDQHAAANKPKPGGMPNLMALQLQEEAAAFGGEETDGEEKGEGWVSARNGCFRPPFPPDKMPLTCLSSRCRQVSLPRSKNGWSGDL